MAWWESESDAPAAEAMAVAYYRHSAQDRQKNSVEIQSDQVRAWAAQHRVTIIHEFADSGKSGLTAEGRPAFTEMMDWVRTRTDFTLILVLDVSRWGRFQDLDLSAQYSSECTRFGKEVRYVNLGVEHDDSPVYPLVVTLERYRSAQYSRELSDKVFKGCVKVAQQGYRAGGSAPYATQRVMVDEQNAPQRVLSHGERKSIQNWRVKLAPGDALQVEIVQDIFHQFVDRNLDERQIAGQLNNRGVVSPGGRAWTSSSIQRILRNRTYAGAVVYNRTTGKLKSGRRSNPPSSWVIAQKAYQPIVPAEIFERAVERFEERQRQITPDAVLERLRAIQERYGTLTKSLIAADEVIPSLGAVTRHFGGMTEMLYRLYADVRERARAEVAAQIVAMNGTVQTYRDFMVINERFSVLIQPSIPVHGYESPYWLFRPDHRPEVDITLGVPLGDRTGGEILGYVAMPRLMMPTGWMSLSGSNLGLISLHGFTGLDFLKEYAK
jgi:DNA invertase Pin-like site-specific DNA recombinase